MHNTYLDVTINMHGLPGYSVSDTDYTKNIKTCKYCHDYVTLTVLWYIPCQLYFISWSFVSKASSEALALKLKVHILFPWQGTDMLK